MKYEYELKLASDAKVNSKKFFSYIRSKSLTKDKVHPLKDRDQNLVFSDKDICTLLNDYFTSVFTHENSAIAYPTLNYRLESENNETVNSVIISENVVCKLLQELKVGKAPGPDGLHPALLQGAARALCKPVTKIFNATLNKGIVPDAWKKANVTALFKSGPKWDPANYRPVSLTSCLCKILEKCIKNEMMQHVSKYEIIKDSQHGFLPGKSCLTNLIEFLHYCHENVDKGKPVDIIYLDFSKAFDRVPHSRLIYKLESYGFNKCIIAWIQNWLNSRVQRVVLNGSASEWSMVCSGIPQGSVLGPLLFILYINDIDSDIVSRLSKFADDTKLFSEASSTEQALLLQQDLDNLYQWSQDWLMLFNIKKCKVMHLGQNNMHVSYKLGGETLSTVDEEKDLGVIIQSDLKVSAQCLKAVKSSKRILGLICRNFSNHSADIIIKLYKSMVRPHLEYCIQAWRPHYQKDIILLENVQRRATKLIQGFRDIKYEERLQLTGLTTLETRRLRGDLIEIFKMLKGFDKVNVHSLFTFTTSNTRGHDLKLYKGGVLTDIGKFSFPYRAISEWNFLTSDIIACNNVNTFKNKLDSNLRFKRGFT